MTEDRKRNIRVVRKGEPLELKVGEKPLPLGWIVLLVPLTIVVLVLVFERTKWVAERTEVGSITEATSHNSLGLDALKEGRYRMAYQQFMTALRIMPEYPEPYMNLGNLFRIYGNRKQAIEYLRKAIDLGLKNKELAYGNMGTIYAESGEYDQALAMFRKALESQIQTAPVYRNIAKVYMAKGDWNEAIEAYKRVIENHPTLKVQYLEMLREVLQSSDEEDIRKVAREQIARGVDDSTLAEYDQQIVLEYLRKDPQNVEDFINLGRAYERTGDTISAADAYRRAIELSPSNPTYHNKLGVLYAKNGDYEKAMSAFLEAVRLDPHYDEARHNLEQCRRAVSSGRVRDAQPAPDK